MSNAAEAIAAKSPLAASLAEGVKNITLDAELTFAQYRRYVLPADGFVFWLVAGPTLVVQASLHYATTRQQNEDETVGVNTVTVTALQQVTELNNVEPDILWLSTLPDGVRYGFSSQDNYFEQADLFHYTGVAVLPAMESQIIDDLASFDKTAQVVSNSLPFWLALNTYKPPYAPSFTTNVAGVGFINAGVTLYPSFAIPDNIAPPYGAVHIEPGETETAQSAPTLGPDLSQQSLCMDRVKVTLYGVRNDAAMTFLSAVLQYSYDYDMLGMANMPTVRDEKRTQVEMAVLAMKKSITFDVWYNQGTARDIARGLIEEVVNNYYPQPLSFYPWLPPSPA